MAIQKAAQTKTKFTNGEHAVKQLIKNRRKELGLNMQEAARLLELEVKNLEDLETVRNYGCHVQWHHIVRLCKGYNMTLDTFESCLR